MIHAFQLRAETKRTSRQRQLRHRVALLLVFGIGLLWSVAAHSADSPARDELAAADLMATALLARDAGPDELRQMERIYADLVARHPEDATVKNSQAEFQWSTGAQAKAVDSWLAAEKLNPADATVLDHLGGSFLAAGDARKAAAYYFRATESAPDDARHHYNYANVAFLFRHELLDPAHPDAAAVLRHALAHFAAASRLQPLNPEYARAYAETFYTVPDADWRSALLAWQHLYEISPAKDFALVNQARVYLKLGNKPEARESLARVQSQEFDRVKARLRERIEAE